MCLITILTSNDLFVYTNRPLHFCAASGNPDAIRYAAVTLKLNAYAGTSYGANLTNIALRSQSQSAVDVCRNELKVSPDGDINDLPPAMDMLKSELPSELKLLRDKKDSSLEKDAKGRTVVLIAASEGDTHTIELALSIGRCLLARDLSGWNVLHWAVQSRSLEAVRFVSNRAPQSLFTQRNDDNQTPVALAESLKFKEAVSLLQASRKLR